MDPAAAWTRHIRRKEDLFKAPELGNVVAEHAPAALGSRGHDLTKCIRLQLGRGTFEGEEIFSKRQSREMESPNTLQPLSEGAVEYLPGRHFSAYAMGWGTYDYYGRKIINHSGGLDSMLSYTVLIPEENVGFVVLTNSESPGFSIM